jgi:hypothetical protein
MCTSSIHISIFDYLHHLIVKESFFVTRGTDRVTQNVVTENHDHLLTHGFSKLDTTIGTLITVKKNCCLMMIRISFHLRDNELSFPIFLCFLQKVLSVHCNGRRNK